MDPINEQSKYFPVANEDVNTHTSDIQAEITYYHVRSTNMTKAQISIDEDH